MEKGDIEDIWLDLEGDDDIEFDEESGPKQLEDDFSYFFGLEVMEKLEKLKLQNLSMSDVENALLADEDEDEEEFDALDEELDQMLDELLVEEDLIDEALDSLDMLDSMGRARDLVGTEGRDLEVEEVAPGHLLHTLLLGISLAATLLLLCLILALTCKASSSYSKIPNPASPV